MPKYTCEHCGAQFNLHHNLIKHQRNTRYCIQLQGHNCEYCNTSFAAKSALVRHQKTAKYCIQSRKNESTTECEYCACIINEHNREKHYEACERKPHNDKTTVLAEKMVDMFERLMQVMIEKPSQSPNATGTTTNRNVNLNNLQPLTEERLQEQLDHLTIDFITDGAKGYASFANCYPFKDLIVCTDISRKKLKYKNSEGEIVSDGGGVKLSQLFFSAIASKNEELINREYSVLQREVQQIAENGSTHDSNITELLVKASRLQDILTQCKEAARGEENELTKEFINHLSKLL